MKNKIMKNVVKFVSAIMAFVLLMCPADVLSGKTSANAADSRVFKWGGYAGSCAYHQTGFDVGSGTWHANVTCNAGYLAYGPYESAGRGNATATFCMAIDFNTIRMRNEFGYYTNDIVCYIDVYNASKDKIVRIQPIYRSDFKESLTYQNFTLNFVSRDRADLYEYRVYYCGNSGLWLGSITNTHYE